MILGKIHKDSEILGYFDINGVVYHVLKYKDLYCGVIINLDSNTFKSLDDLYNYLRERQKD